MLIRLFILLFSIICITSCNSFSSKKQLFGKDGNGNVVTIIRDVLKFKSLIVNENCKINFIQNPYKNEFKIKCDKNLIKYLSLSVTNEVCTISFDEQVTPSVFELEISISELKELVVNSELEFICSEQIKARNFKLIDNGSGSVLVNLAADSIFIFKNKDSYIKVLGGCNSLNITNNQSDDIDASTVTSNVAKVTTNSSGDVLVGSTKTLTTAINASGNIYYTSFDEIIKNNTGSGEVLKK